MRVSNAFQSVVEPSLERIAVLETRHVERHDGRDYVVSHVFKRNIFTAFDAKLSRHLAAVRGDGFPAITVEARLRKRRSAGRWHPVRPTDHVSVPHALLSVARRALGDGEAATLHIHHHGFNDALAEEEGQKRVVRREDVEVLDRALAVCAHFGEPAFLDISGDFDVVTVRPGLQELKPVLMDLYDRRLAIPPMEGSKGDPVEAPIYDFGRLAADSAELRAYLATARHGLAFQKEAAVQAFRAAAEERILEFDKALAGRELACHRLDAVISLVMRLKAGLGDGLRGLSEDARLRALDWAEAIERNAGSGPAQSAPEWPSLGMEGGSRSAHGAA